MLPLALATLTLVLTDLQKLPLDEAALRAATEAALAGSGTVVEWQTQPPGEGRTQRESEARVILTSRDPSARGGERVLGAVVRERGPALAVWIYVEEVRRALEGAERSLLPSARRKLSVAVGRVLAHELAHLLAPGHSHSSKGLMARWVDRGVLRGAAPLDQECLTAIRAAASAPPAAGLAPATGGPMEARNAVFP